MKNQGLTERLNELAGKRQHGRTTAFAKKVGIGEPLASVILQGRVPRSDTLLKIARAYGKSIDWLVTGQELGQPIYTANLEIISPEEAERRRMEAGSRINAFIPAPLYANSASLGYGRIIDDREIEDYVLLPRRIVRKGARVACVRAFGESMLPTLQEGDIVAIDCDFRDHTRLHKRLVCANLGGEGEEAEVTIKELRIRKGRLYLRAHNPAWEEEHGQLELDIREGIILGKVISMFREFK